MAAYVLTGFAQPLYVLDNISDDNLWRPAKLYDKPLYTNCLRCELGKPAASAPWYHDNFLYDSNSLRGWKTGSPGTSLLQECLICTQNSRHGPFWPCWWGCRLLLSG